MERKKTKGVSTAVILTTLALASCGKQDTGALGELNLNDGKVIIGSLDWRDITDLSRTSPLRKNGIPVAKISLPVSRYRRNESRCTGFLIAPDVIMTNHHCIPHSGHAEGVTATFKLEKGIPKTAQKKYDCSTFYGNNEELDFALLKCSERPGEVFGTLSLSSEVLNQGDNVYVIQQNCDYYRSKGCDPRKRISFGRISETAQEYSHNADTLGGSSGSPVFSARTDRVIGLHHAGQGNGYDGRGVMNMAVRMDRIIHYIESYLGHVSLSPSGTSSETPVDFIADAGGTLPTSLNFRLPNLMEGQEIAKKDDLDIFNFTITFNRNVKVSLEFLHGHGDLDLYLLDSQGEVVEKSTSVTDMELIHRSLPAGKYFIVVKGYQGAMGDYKLVAN